MGRNEFLLGRKPFFREETPKGYSNLTMQTDVVVPKDLLKTNRYEEYILFY